MHPNDLIEFRNNIALPHMMEIFEKTHIPDGACYIDNLEITLLDCRNCGFDNHVQASGLIYRNGKAEEYLYDECDVDLNEFFASHQNCIFISEGHLRLGDELEEMDLNTRLIKMKDCERFFSWFDCPEKINIEMISVQYEKLKFLIEAQEAGSKKPMLASVIQSASSRASEATAVNNAHEKSNFERL